MNTYAYQVMPEDTDSEGLMKISSLCRCAINAIGRFIKEEGFGVDVMLGGGRTWTLSRYALEFDKRPKLYGSFSISVWDGEPGNVTVTRCLRLTDGSGHEIGRGVTDWCVIDCGTRGLVKPPAPLSSERSALAAPCGKPSRITAAKADKCESLTVRRSDCDFNGHMNNVRYVDVMFDIMPHDDALLASPVRLSAFFHRESLEGDRLTCSLARVSDGYECIISKSSLPVCSLSLREL